MERQIRLDNGQRPVFDTDMEPDDDAMTKTVEDVTFRVAWPQLLYWEDQIRQGREAIAAGKEEAL